MRYVTPTLVLPLLLLASSSTVAANSASLHAPALACSTPGALPSVATADAAWPRGPAPAPTSHPPAAPLRQQRSGDGTGESDSRSAACADAQADAANSAEHACDGPFSVDSCRCERDERDPDDPDDDIWSCTAYWRCPN